MENVIDRAELRRRLQQGDRPVVVEALPERYYAEGHIPGALNLPLASNDADVRRLLPDRDVEVVTYCTDATCMNSRKLAARLGALGYSTVRVYIDGKADWSDAGYTLEVRS